MDPSNQISHCRSGAGHDTVMHDTKVKENHVSADGVWLMKPQVVPVFRKLISATEDSD
jgi:hypothetical protein